MKITQIPFKSTGFFSKTILDYIEQKDKIKPFYNNFPDISGFHKQIEEKEKSYKLQSRLVLVEALKSNTLILIFLKKRIKILKIYNNKILLR